MDTRALAIDPGFMRARRGLVTMQMKLGNVQIETNPAATLREFEAALKANDALPKAEQERLNMQRLHALLLRKQATTLSELQRYSEARPIFAESFVIYKRLSSSDPNDIRALEDVNRELGNEAASYANAGNPLLVDSASLRQRNLRRSEQHYLQEEATLKKLVEAAPKDNGFKTTIDFVHVRLGTIRWQLHEEQSEQQMRSMLAELKSDATHDSASLMTLDLVVTAYLQVEPAALRDPSYTLTLAKRGDLLTHHKSPTWQLSLAQAYRADSKTPEAQSSAEKALSLLPIENRNNGNSRVYRLLQRKLMKGSRSTACR